MMTLRFVAKGKKLIWQILFAKLSSLTRVYLRESRQRLSARGAPWGLIDSREIQEPSETKTIFVWMNRWIISIWDLFTHELPTKEKGIGRFVTAKGLLLSWLLYSIYPGWSWCLSSSAGFSRNLAWEMISSIRLWSSSYLQAGTFHF